MFEKLAPGIRRMVAGVLIPAGVLMLHGLELFGSPKCRETVSVEQATHVDLGSSLSPRVTRLNGMAGQKIFLLPQIWGCTVGRPVLVSPWDIAVRRIRSQWPTAVVSGPEKVFSPHGTWKQWTACRQRAPEHIAYPSMRSPGIDIEACLQYVVSPRTNLLVLFIPQANLASDGLVE
jgi:hypothetical protein